MDEKKSFWKHIVGMAAVFLVISALLVWNARRQAQQPDAGDHKECSITGFAFDTVYTITLYHGGNQKILNACVEQCTQYEQIFSRTQENSELYRINLLSELCEQQDRAEIERLDAAGRLPAYQELQDGGLEIEISEPLAELINAGIHYGGISQGKFDITIEPVSSLWSFTAEKPALPDRMGIEQALPFVDYKNLAVQQQKLWIKKPGTRLDLGGIAKGYIADRLKKYLLGQGVDSALISLGGNILCIGSKPDGSMFRIGIQQPFADRNETIVTVALQDQSVVSSGIYERYFTDHDTIYHHILDSETGYPVENDLMAVTIISDKSVDGDGLSTTCFGLGLQDGMELINQREGITAAFITRDEQLHYADGFQELVVSQ